MSKRASLVLSSSIEPERTPAGLPDCGPCLGICMRVLQSRDLQSYIIQFLCAFVKEDFFFWDINSHLILYEKCSKIYRNVANKEGRCGQ